MVFPLPVGEDTPILVKPRESASRHLSMAVCWYGRSRRGLSVAWIGTDDDELTFSPSSSSKTKLGLAEKLRCNVDLSITFKRMDGRVRNGRMGPCHGILGV